MPITEENLLCRLYVMFNIESSEENERKAIKIGKGVAKIKDQQKQVDVDMHKSGDG